MNRAPIGATALLEVKGRSNGTFELTFACGTGERKTILTVQPYDRRPLEMGINPNDVLLETWGLLDRHIEGIHLSRHADEQQYHKAAARATCEVLALFMPPFFTTADEVGREGMQRYKNRDNPDYETPGLGVKSLAAFDSMPMANNTPQPVKIPVEITEKQQESIKMGLEAGMFTTAQLAKTYGVSEAVIEAIRTA